MLTTSMIHGKVIKALYSLKIKWMSRIGRQMMLSIFAKEEWNSVGYNKNKEK